ncbi:MAG: hypothetical protein KA766_11845 [Piscinibacter sp.]|uniref:hypothetical protein n=1 Tax=Piscinibacter sp. TaxID=1903157 RepID=UPI001B6C6AAE|nr:hypothetical protein [Piscinibacter sp.]MBP5990688.1 hypothetical protein [Piscinibacter sp.]
MVVKFEGKAPIQSDPSGGYIEKPPAVTQLGTVVPSEMPTRFKWGGKALIAGTLSVAVANCAHASGGTCSGQGTIQPTGIKARGAGKPILRDGDMGMCNGVRVSPPASLPEKCPLKLKATGGGGGAGSGGAGTA